ncbi:conserved hypothetical protein [Frankia sp. AiPs1]|uniref:hypothetical protein n=1 Tax=Frankia sp. AiPa1 TaxID=573492 RepID=UPI0035A88D1F
MQTRRFQVYDGDGELVASFPEWETAHSWAHRRAAEPATHTPVQIEDRSDRRTWTVDGDRCRLTVWRRRVEYGYCEWPCSDGASRPAGGGVLAGARPSADSA